MDLKLDKFNVRDATLRSLLALANEFGIKDPSKEQMEKLQDISDTLENRVQDEIDKALKNFKSVGASEPRGRTEDDAPAPLHALRTRGAS